MSDKKFIIYWRDGSTVKLTGPSIEVAFSNAGYSNAAVAAVDFYSEGEIPTHGWDVEKKKWVPVDPSTIPGSQVKLNEKYDLIEITDENNRENYNNSIILNDLETVVYNCKETLKSAEEELRVYKNKQVIAELGLDFVLELGKIHSTKGRVECLKTLRVIDPQKYDLGTAISFVKDVFE